MFSDHLETVILGDVQDSDHRLVNDITDRCPIIGGVALDEINSNERHEKASFWVGVRSFLICGKSFSGGRLRGDNKARSSGKKLLGIGVFTRTSELIKNLAVHNQKYYAIDT